MSGELADMDGDAVYELPHHDAVENFAEPVAPAPTNPNTISALVLCTDPEVWAAEFIKASPMDDSQVAEWFGAAMETKRMMAIASLPLPRSLFQ